MSAVEHDLRPNAVDRRTPEDPIGDEGRTGLMVVPPPEVCAVADRYRRIYHPAAFERLPPHMTVLYPYAPPESWPGLLPRLEAVACSVSPFTVRLVKWGGGRGGQDGGFGWLTEDPGPFMAMYAKFMAATPEQWRPQHAFRPHLTIGWFPGGAGYDEAWAAVQREPVDQAFAIDHLWLGRAGKRGVWSLEHRLELKGGE